MEKLKQIKISDKNYGGLYTFYFKELTYKNKNIKYITCTTPENAFGYSDNIILYNVMKFDDNKMFVGYEKKAHYLNRHLPNWIINKIEKILLKLSLKYNCD